MGDSKPTSMLYQDLYNKKRREEIMKIRKDIKNKKGLFRIIG